MKLPEDVDLNQLCMSAQRARLVLRFPREERLEAVRATAGFHYSEEGSDQPQPINMLEMYRTIVGNKLASNNPRCNMTTDLEDARPVAQAMMTWVNKQITKINLVETLQRANDDSLYWVGIIKTSLATPGVAASYGWSVKAGEPFSEVVDPDDIVWDIHCRRLDQPSFVGHRYRIPLAVAKKMYGKGRDLQASDDKMYNMEGDERISNISRTTIAGQEEFEPMIDLWEFYLPRHKLVVTLRDDDLCGSVTAGWGGYNKGRALDIQPWIGPDHGPFRFLAMKWVPGNPSPKGTIPDLVDMNEAIQRLCRKLMRQGDRQKEVIVATGGASKDVNQLLVTNDGEAMYADRPDQLKSVLWGGPNQQNMQLLNSFIERFSWMAGNLDLLGGLGPQSKTAKQDELLNENSSATIGSMQQKAMAFATGVISDLCWFWYHDPYKVMEVTYALPGMPNITTPIKVHPHPANGDGRKPNTMYREYKFEDLNIHIAPYSLQYQSPQQLQAQLDQVVTQIILPLMQLLQAKGIEFDVEAYLQKKARLQDMPDLLELVKMVQQPQFQGTTEDEANPSMPTSTSREYTRRSEAGATPAGAQMEIANGMSPPAMPNGVHKV